MTTNLNLITIANPKPFTLWADDGYCFHDVINESDRHCCWCGIQLNMSTDVS